MKTDELYAEMLATTGARNTPDMENAFLSALKKVVQDLNSKLGESIVAPDVIDSTDMGFEDYCDNVFHPGAKFFMQRSGAWAQDPDVESVNFYQAELRQVIGAAIAADTDFQVRNQAED